MLYNEIHNAIKKPILTRYIIGIVTASLILLFINVSKGVSLRVNIALSQSQNSSTTEAVPSTPDKPTTSRGKKPKIPENPDRGHWKGPTADYGMVPHRWEDEGPLNLKDNNDRDLSVDQKFEIKGECDLAYIGNYWVWFGLVAAYEATVGKPKNIICDVNGKPFKSGAVVQRFTPIIIWGELRGADARGWFFSRSTAARLESECMKLRHDNLLVRIIYEQRKSGQKLREVQKNFITFNNDKYKERQQSMLRLVFMGEIEPDAFKADAFAGFLGQSKRALHLTFDLENNKDALRILPKEVFGQVLNHNHEEVYKLPDTSESSMPKLYPVIPSLNMLRAPAIISPPQNKFVVDCSDPRNLWLRDFSLANKSLDNRKHRYLYFWCEDGETDVNKYLKWFGGSVPFELPKIPEDNTGDSNTGANGGFNSPTPSPLPPQPITESSSNWWIFLLVGLLVIIIIVALIMYFMLSGKEDNVPQAQSNASSIISSKNPSVRSSSRLSRSSVGPRNTARSALSSTAHKTSSVRSKSSMSKPGRSSSMRSSPASRRRSSVASQSKLPLVGTSASAAKTPSSVSRLSRSGKSQSPASRSSPISSSRTSNRVSSASSPKAR